MDLFSHFLSAVSVDATTISKWRLHSPWGVNVNAFAPGFFLTQLSGPPITIHSGGLNYELTTGDALLAPKGASCQICTPGATNFAPIEALEWQGQNSDTYDIHAHLGQAMAVTVGSQGEPSVLAGVAFELELTHATLIAECLPAIIMFKADQSSLLQQFHPLIRHIFNDNNPGYFAVATQVAELLIISALRTFITSQNEFPTGVLKALSDRYLHKALQVIHDKYHQSLSVELLARTASMSRSNFMAQFKKQVGVPPMIYINRLRINQAQALLSKTQLPVSQIAEQVGFHSDRAFRQAFKGQTGLAPREYRDQSQALTP
ncbi:AraC family transcriptional regulator [Alteromonas sp. ZYF713]|nr:AraC family transcriptional regulator [Alteromonas sp. ZYF713]